MKIFKSKLQLLSMQISIKIIVVSLAIFSTGSLNAQPSKAGISKNFYRIPYEDGTIVKINNDHRTHTPPNKYDIEGILDSRPYKIVAAADGWIRFIVDDHTETCTEPGCWQFNNYVVIEHENGEWSNYTHLATGSVRGDAGLSEGTFVSAGTFLGYEDEVGHATGIHLHFDVGVPNDPNNPIYPIGGFIKGSAIIPLICNIPGNIMRDDHKYIATDCYSGNCTESLSLSSNTLSDDKVAVYQAEDFIIKDVSKSFIVDSSAALVLHAGNNIVLKDGFHIRENAYFRAEIGPCNTTAKSVESSDAVFASTSVSISGLKEIGKQENEFALNKNNIADLPEAFVLFQNYPNPFNPTTTIKYALKEAVHVSLKIYNVRGQEIRALVNEHQPAGYRQVIWDGRNEFGSPVASGIYFYRMVASSPPDGSKHKFVHTGQMTLMK